jgi:hypothetical protein
MAIAAVLALTLDPALRMLFTRMDFVQFRPRWLAWLVNHATVGRYHPEEKHPVSRLLFAAYEPACRAVLRWPKATIAAAALVVATTVPVYLRLGHEFMPPLNEGVMLYMPITLPGISVTEAARLLQVQGRPRRDLDGPGAAVDDRDHRGAEAALRVEAEAALVLLVGAGMAEGCCVAARLAGPHLVGRVGRPDGRGPPDSRHHQRLDHADQEPHRHADDRHPHARRHQDLRQ